MQRFNKLIISIVALFILPLFSCTDNSSEKPGVDMLTLRGAVFDKDNGKPIPGIQALLSTGESAATDMHGNFSFSVEIEDNIFPDSIRFEDIDGEDNGSYSPTEMELNLDVKSSAFNADSHLFKVEGVEVFLSRLN